ncbi:MAG: S1 RNA-binding domain-containing protein [Phycisphaerales bacterium]
MMRGAFIELAPGSDGMCHVSELAHGFVKNVTDVVKIGDVVKVKVINVDDSGRVKLSRKALMEMPAGGEGGGGGGDRGDRGDRGPRGGDRGPRGDRGDRRDGGRREREGSPSGSDRA